MKISKTCFKDRYRTADELNHVKEDLVLKRKLIDKMGQSDKDLKECLSKVTKTMETISKTTKTSVQLMGPVIHPSVPPTQQYHYGHHTPQNFQSEGRTYMNLQ